MDASSSEPLDKKLAMIPLSAWEEELPSVELVIRETIRLLVNLGIPRWNTRRSVAIDGVTIEKGDFVMYSAAQVHLNPGIYSNPTTFDPERYVPGREEDKREGLAYLGWGVGELLGDSDNYESLFIKMSFFNPSRSTATANTLPPSLMASLTHVTHTI